MINLIRVGYALAAGSAFEFLLREESLDLFHCVRPAGIALSRTPKPGSHCVLFGMLLCPSAGMGIAYIPIFIAPFLGILLSIIFMLLIVIFDRGPSPSHMRALYARIVGDISFGYMTATAGGASKKSL